jgi:flavoprotein
MALFAGQISGAKSTVNLLQVPPRDIKAGIVQARESAIYRWCDCCLGCSGVACIPKQ